MPKSVASHHSLASRSSRQSINNNDNDGDLEDYDDDYEIDEQQAEAIRNAHRNAFSSAGQQHQQQRSRHETMQPRHRALHRASDGELSLRVPSRTPVDETTGLLNSPDLTRSGYRTGSIPGTPRFKRSQSYVHSVRGAPGSRRGSFARGLMKALERSDEQTRSGQGMSTSRRSFYWDNRVWYDQFTSTDWVHDSIADSYRVKELRSRKDFKGRVKAFFDGAQGWVLVFIIGCITAGFAFMIDVTEAKIFDFKSGHCHEHWYLSKRQCCDGASVCDDWHKWSHSTDQDVDGKLWVDYAAFVAWVAILALAACAVTLMTKTTISSAISLSTLDENLGADHHNARKTNTEGGRGAMSPTRRFQEAARRPPVTYYPAAGSGVAEVRVILSGFVLHGYLGVKTLICKTLGLVLSVGSGLSIGKEGPYVHIATCIGNIVSRGSSKYRNNDAKRREILSASAAAGVAVAFGAPIGGILFALEEVSYYFPPKTLFRTFFCCIAAALSLKFLDPYGTGKIVLFEVRYLTDWKFFEVIVFALLGVLGGTLGALFIKASRLWAKTFRRIGVIKSYPMLEVFVVAVITGLVSFWNRYTRIPVAELLYELAAPCSAFSSSEHALCPTEEEIPTTIKYLFAAFVIKAVLTIVTFGIKVPAGIYVPSMVVGGLLGRIVGHVVQLLIMKYPDLASFANCPNDGSPEACVVPGVYALVAAGATMCGVTRLSVTLAIILFELTGSLEHVLPFSMGVLIAKWTADALEPLSIYDLLTDMNAYPYLDHKVRPVFDTDLGDITSGLNSNRYIDISSSPLVSAKSLRYKLEYLHMAGELDGGLPILRDNALVGLIPGPDLEYALDHLESEEDAMCLMSLRDERRDSEMRGRTDTTGENDGADEDGATITNDDPVPPEEDPTDFTRYIDPAPVSLEVSAPMDLVFECFVKLGLRYICVLQHGRYIGMVHKKAFVRYVKHVQDSQHEA